MNVNDIESFKADGRREIAAMAADHELRAASQRLMNLANAQKYSYHFSWLGLPIIQYPQDVMAMQEIIWETRPEVIVETGVARGGSLIFYASLLELTGGGEVIGIDIDIRPHNREAIEAHPLSKRISLIQGSSIAQATVDVVASKVGRRRTLVVLDSNHTHAHVLAELRSYAPLVSVGSYCVVMDTVVEDMPADSFPDRPWGKGDNPKTAVQAYLAEDPRFEVDRVIEHKLLLTVAPGGWLRRRV